MSNDLPGGAAGAQPWDKGQLFCNELPTKFQPQLGRILVTGASGYIGGRLVPELLARGYKVRAMVRSDFPEYRVLWPGAEIAIAENLGTQYLIEQRRFKRKKDTSPISAVSACGAEFT